MIWHLMNVPPTITWGMESASVVPLAAPTVQVISNAAHATQDLNLFPLWHLNYVSANRDSSEQVILSMISWYAPYVTPVHVWRVKIQQRLALHVQLLLENFYMIPNVLLIAKSRQIQVLLVLLIENAILVVKIALIVSMQHFVIRWNVSGNLMQVVLKLSIMMVYARQCAHLMLCPIQSLKIVITAALNVQNAKPRQVIVKFAS